MTREEAINILKGAIKKPNTKDGYIGQSIDMAIDTMYKYQKIEQALSSWNMNCINDREFINTIRKVINND